MKHSVPLSSEAKKLKRTLIAEYGISDAGGLLLVQTVCECHDQMRKAQEQIAADGQLMANRFGELRPHPSVVVEKDARAHMLLALKALGLDLQPIKPIGRPPGNGGMH